MVLASANDPGAPHRRLTLWVLQMNVDHVVLTQPPLVFCRTGLLVCPLLHCTVGIPSRPALVDQFMHLVVGELFVPGLLVQHVA